MSDAGATAAWPRELHGAPSPEQFWAEFFPAQIPVVWRGALADHPLVELGRRGPEVFLRELAQRAGENPVTVTSATPTAGGRMGFNEGKWVDWANRETSFAAFADDVLHELRAPSGHVYYLQSATVREALPELGTLASLWLTDTARMLDERTQLWIGSGGQRIPVHRDESHSIAAMATGSKDFILFPPDQLHNLHTTPRKELAGDPMRSAADPRHPDFATYPRFREAMATMQIVHLEPGDILFVPAHWWHAVDSHGFNAMFNTRWFDVPLEQRGDLTACFAHAVVTARTVAPDEATRFRAQLRACLFVDDGVAAQAPAARAALHEQLRAAVATSRRERPSPLRGPDVPLRIHPRATASLAADAIELRQGHARHFLDWAYLPLVDAFFEPTTPRAALEALGKSYDFEPDEAIARIRGLCEDGILVAAEPGERPPESAASQRARVDAATAHIALQMATMPLHHLRAFEGTLETFAFLTHGAPYPHLPAGEQGMLGVPLQPEAAAIFFERVRRNLNERLASALVPEDFWTRRYRLAPGQSCTIGADGFAWDDKASGSRHHIGWRQLEALAHFREPRTPTEALQRLREEIEATDTQFRELVISMLAAGAIVPA